MRGKKSPCAFTCSEKFRRLIGLCGSSGSERRAQSVCTSTCKTAEIQMFSRSVCSFRRASLFCCPVQKQEKRCWMKYRVKLCQIIKDTQTHNRWAKRNFYCITALKVKQSSVGNILIFNSFNDSHMTKPHIVRRNSGQTGWEEDEHWLLVV